ncbi:kinase-like protein [Ceratobasidium sp. AG-I]|nr:kinase-like protein [Ceratobasidium sp. AG-I]
MIGTRSNSVGDSSTNEASAPPPFSAPSHLYAKRRTSDMNDTVSRRNVAKSKSQPNVLVAYDDFFGMFEGFENETTNRPNTAESVTGMLNSHPDLIQDFNTFLPRDFHQHSHNFIAVNTPFRNATQTAVDPPSSPSHSSDIYLAPFAPVFRPHGEFLPPLSSLYRDTSLQTPPASPVASTLDRDGTIRASATPTISGTMAASDVISSLVRHGCKDITGFVDFSTCSRHPISTGGFGDIYRAKLKDGRPVAIKCMRLRVDAVEGQRHLKHAAREIHTWSKCDHQHVLKLLGLMQFRGQIGMVSLWIAYGSLAQYLNRNPEADRQQMCEQVACGLVYLHDCGVVHGDLKGANVLVSEDGDALLTDFGNAVLRERTLKFTSTTAKSHLSPRWAAPELFQEEGSFSVEADVFALGMTMLEIVTGSIPYHRMNDLGVIYAIVSGRLPERPEDTIPMGRRESDVFWSLLVRCWNIVPELRPSGFEVWSDLIFSGMPGLSW